MKLESKTNGKNVLLEGIACKDQAKTIEPLVLYSRKVVRDESYRASHKVPSIANT